MEPAPRTAEEVLDRLDTDQIERLWVIYHDYSGRAQAKTVPRPAFRSTVERGLGFAMANLNMDSLDHQATGATLLAGSGDFQAVPDPRSYAVIPYLPATARLHAWMRLADGTPFAGCPRERLRATIETLATAGFTAQVAFEPEFYLLRHVEGTEYAPANRTTMFSRDGLVVADTFIVQLLGELGRLGIEVTQLGKEYGQGQYEVNFRHADALGAVDDYLTVTGTVRDVARREGLVATFMPKPYAGWPGNSLHVHISLWNETGRELFPAIDEETTISDTGRWFIGGILNRAAALTGLGCPTVNSYKRLLPGSWAPANTYWGIGNRSGMVRVPGLGGRRHIEVRSGDNSCQPFLYLTGLLAAGLDGIQRQVDPGPAFEGDVGQMTPAQIMAAGIGFLPRFLPEALDALEADPVIGEAIGEEAMRHFLAVKRNELFEHNFEVHPWERATYLEVI